MRRGQHGLRLDGITGSSTLRLLLQLETVPPGRQLVGKGLDRVEVADGRVGDERANSGRFYIVIGSRSISGSS